MGQLAILFILCMVSYPLIATAAEKFFNVVDYGAVGDGKTDDAKAFSKAWWDACNSASGDQPSMLIPGRKIFLVTPLTFKGPCKAKIVNVKIYGGIVAPNTPSAWSGIDPSRWLEFYGINGLHVTGAPGLINGRGSGWWDQSCRYHPKLPGCTSLAPTALRFFNCNGLRLEGMHLINSPQTHLLIIGCKDVQISRIHIRAPQNSPNTDGIHIQSSQDVIIYISNIETGDDCISIGDYNSHLHIKYAYCGFGHGISIGSLGMAPHEGGTEAQVEDIHVENANFYNTTNGARIKTWQGGSGYARGISFRQLNFTNVENPIIIDQNYCDVVGACKPQPTGVRISNVTYSGMKGTSSTEVAVNFVCSDAVACTEILLEDIKLGPADSGNKIKSSCNNAYGRTKGVVQPQSCLKS